MDMERLYAKAAAPGEEIDRIEKLRDILQDILTDSAALVAAKVPGCDLGALLDHIDDGLADMFGDVLDRLEEERREADDAISDAEFADICRRSPVVL